MVPNHEKKGDYYVNAYYPSWKTNFDFKNGRKRNLSYESKASISFIPNKENVILNRKEIIM